MAFLNWELGLFYAELHTCFLCKYIKLDFPVGFSYCIIDTVDLRKTTQKVNSFAHKRKIKT